MDLSQINSSVIITAISILILWIFAKAMRWLINIGLIIFVIVFIVFNVPTIKEFFTSLIR